MSETPDDNTENNEIGTEEKRDSVTAGNAKERLYDKIPVSVQTLDKIIAVLFVVLILAVIIGFLKGQGM